MHHHLSTATEDLPENPHFEKQAHICCSPGYMVLGFENPGQDAHPACYTYGLGLRVKGFKDKESNGEATRT